VRGTVRIKARPKPMMRTRKSDPAIVGEAGEQSGAAHCGASAGASGAGGAKGGDQGNGSAKHVPDAGRLSVTQALDRIRKVAGPTVRFDTPEVGPYAGKPHVRICAGRCDEAVRPTAASSSRCSGARRHGRSRRARKRLVASIVSAFLFRAGGIRRRCRRSSTSCA
jgi:hypothetical protein